MAAKKGRGGAREGAGRKPVGGETRHFRVVVMLTEQEYRKLEAVAAEHQVARSTAAYELLSRALARRK